MASFKIQLRIARILARSTANTQQERVDLCLQILTEVVIDAFIQDITDLVRQTVKAVKDEADVHPEKHNVEWVKVRWDSFTRWEQIKHRLDYGEDYDTYSLLARALGDSEDDPVRGLPQGNIKSISIGDLAQSIHDICRRAEVRQQIRAPVWRDGNLASVTRMALAIAHSRMGSSISEEDKRSQIIKFLSDALLNRHVHFFPNAPDSSHPTPSTDSWSYCGNPPTAADIASNNLETIGARRVRLCGEQGRSASQADVTASWSILDCDIESFSTYMDHICLPQEWSFEVDSAILGNTQLLPVYRWASKRLQNPTTDWRTRLAIALAFLFSKLTPNHVFCPDSTKVKEYPLLETVKAQLNSLRPSTRETSISIVRQLPWIDKCPRKGKTNRSLYFTQASVVILAWIDPSSPIRKELKLQRAKSELISMFNSKHCKSVRLLAMLVADIFLL